MKASRLAISTSSDSHTPKEAYLNYILPTKEPIHDFFSARDFTLIISNSGEIWEIGSFLNSSEHTFEYRSLSFNLSIVSITSNGSCTLLLSSQGKVFGWGRSQTGILDPETCSNPTLIKWLVMKKITKVSICNNYAGCIDEQGAAYLWGTFEQVNMKKASYQVNDFKSFTCKEVICKEDFVVVCTDGGFVYYLGCLGIHQKNLQNELSSFMELEELCVVQIAAGDGFIGILTESCEVFVFDGCHQLVQLPVFERVDNIVASREYLVGAGGNLMHKWMQEGPAKKKYFKNFCPLKEWVGKVFKFHEKFEISKVKAMNHLYGLIFTSESFDRIEGNLVKTLVSEESRKSFRRSIEPDVHNLGALVKVLEKRRKNLQIFAFSRVFLEYEHKNSLKLVRNHSRLPYVLVEVVHKKVNRGLMAGFNGIKGEIYAQDLLARERIKQTRDFSKQKQEKILTLGLLLNSIHLRITSKLCKSCLKSLKTHKKLSNSKFIKLSFIFSFTRRQILKVFIYKWSKKTNDRLMACAKFLLILKKLKLKQKQNGFNAISSKSTQQLYFFAKRKTQLLKTLKNFHSKQIRIFFNTWKNIFLKLKAQQERDLKKFQLSVKLGCKYLFPVIEFYLCNYWSIFKLNSFTQVKSRYKHFGQFLHYFIKKKMISFWALSFLRISGSSSLSISPEASQFSQTDSSRECSNFTNSSLVSSLNMLIKTHKKKISSCLGSPKIPKLSLNDSSRGKISSSQSTFRPPWKPASNPNSRGNTPKATKKQNGISAQTNRCLRSLNILPNPKPKLIQKKKMSRSDGIRIEVGLGNFVRGIENIRFRIKFRTFSFIKFYS